MPALNGKPGPSSSSYEGSVSELPALAVRGVSKTFPGGKALDDVTFSLGRGGVHALIGGNGSGKSTLVKALAGIQPADGGGEIRVAGNVVAADSITPSWSRERGLRFVHQDLGMFGRLTVAENLALGQGFPKTGGRIDWPQLRRRATDLLERFEIAADPADPIELLRPADRTMVAIARAMQDRYEEEGEPVSTLVLDEPTAPLPEDEVELLLNALRSYVRDGLAIVFISHRLDEVVSIADTVTVLRDGRLVTSEPAAGLDERDLVRLIVGEALEEFERGRGQGPGGEVVAALSEVAVGPLRRVSLEVHEGEVLGIAGLLGSGRTELLEVFFGVLKPEAGSIRVAGEECRFNGPAQAMERGIAFVPEDRGEAIFTSMNVRENFSLPSLRRYSRGLVNRRREAADATRSMDAFKVKTKGYEDPISFLSGGNQQKVVLARWLSRKPRLLLLDEPTQGVDVGARADAYEIIRDAAAGGTAVIVVSSDFEELADLCDRVLVLSGGQIVGELSREQITPSSLTEQVHTAKGPL